MGSISVPGLLEGDLNVAYLRSRASLRLVVGGWSASGKTVFSRYLAQLLKCEYVSASSLLVESLNLSEVDWIRDRQLLQDRRSPEGEKRLDEALVDLLSRTPRIVLDSWAVPFLTSAHDLAIWVECDIDVRAQNALGPDQLRFHHPEAWAAARAGLLEKDRDSVERFRELYGFIYGPNPDAFPINVDISRMISPFRERWSSELESVLRLLTHAIYQKLNIEDN